MFHNRFMKVIMKHLPTNNIEDIDEYLKSNKDLGISLVIEKAKDKYKFIKNLLKNIKYKKLDKKEKGIVFKYISFFTKYSSSHIKRLISKWKNKKLFYSSNRIRNKFPLIYKPEDITLLIQTDVAHERLNGKATKEILHREFHIFKKKEYETISKISISHIYNIRNNNLQYGSSNAKKFKKTKATQVKIGIRRKPRPNGRPGFLRVDTVHQGDLDKVKGVYHINIVDEATQFEMIATVKQISQLYLRPVIKELLSLFPFKIIEFHSDNGSEFINHVVARLLNKLHIELTKSRSRQSNDNALVESKNGSIIRKLFGRIHIPQKYAKKINAFNKRYVNVYLNYHRPCIFSVDVIDEGGKIKKKYSGCMTPYEKLKSIKNPEAFLKENFNFHELDKIAYNKSDNEFAKEMGKAKYILFKYIHEHRN